jgi:serine/threonine protein kinase
MARIGAMSPLQTIAHYRIIAKLGEDGMGEVWRATDTKLNRDVAIKILLEAFAQDTDRMERFERVAQKIKTELAAIGRAVILSNQAESG